MGCVASDNDINSSHNKELQRVDALINENTKQYKRKERIKTKMMLLGAGESGKSTLLKQMRKLHGDPYSEAELFDHKPFLTQNLIESMRTLACYSDLLGDQGHNTRVSEEHRDIRDKVASMSVGAPFTEQVCEDFAVLITDEGIQRTLELRHEFQLIDTTEYLFANMHKFYDPQYVPTFDDITRCRTRTIGLTKLRFSLKNADREITELYEIFDVGGQKNERRKWLHFFDNTQAIIFVVAISAYNQTLWEDNKSNRLKEAIALFRNTVNLVEFEKASVILFFNKLDLFEQKVGKYPLKQHFKDYKGAETQDEIMEFLEAKFRRQMQKKYQKQRQNKRRRHQQQHQQQQQQQLLQQQQQQQRGKNASANMNAAVGDVSDEEDQRELYLHIASATDSSCVQKMFGSVREIVITKQLIDENLL